MKWSMLGSAMLGSLVVLYMFDPASGGLFPPCVFHVVTGLLCPGCGLTRAVHQLLHGNVSAALGLNALLPLYALLVGGLFTGWIWREVRGYTPRALQLRASLIAASGIAMIGFGVVRNL